MAIGIDSRISHVSVERAANGGFIVRESDSPGVEWITRGRRWAFSPDDFMGACALLGKLLVEDHEEGEADA